MTTLKFGISFIYLRNEGYLVVEAEDGVQALEILQHEKIHLIILDVMMPHLDGTNACLRIREESDIPIIMLSAKEEPLDKITGLSTWADDYVSKPFNPLELIARVKAQLRRQQFITSSHISDPSEIVIDDLIINKKQHTITVHGQEVSLTPIEFSILVLLATHRGQVFNIYNIIKRSGRTKRLFTPKHCDGTYSEYSREPQYIKTVRGVGYKIDKQYLVRIEWQTKHSP
ncbi:response regulator transcription factor [Paenibacillus glacialis]|uniref:response regulator transcription factor n=1 Tax=Paenibacillus glacialis TaxID=494026 RepID=UPI000A82C5A6|nr:response regulator transcription factor [Paenibacillus glacialis]